MWSALSGLNSVIKSLEKGGLGEKNLSSERFFPPIITYELLYKYYSYVSALFLFGLFSDDSALGESQFRLE